MKTTFAILAALMGAAACSDGGDGAGRGDSAGETASDSGAGVESQVVITLHVKGGDESKLKYLQTQVAGFGTCAEAKMDTDTWKIYALMKPGVERQFAAEERNMLEAYIRPPQELLMSSWAYNEGNWFALIGN